MATSMSNISLVPFLLITLIDFTVWFLIKSQIINFVCSLQPTPFEHDLHMFALTWADRANTVQFSIEGKTFLLSFCDSAMFWCFKCMVHCHDQVDCHRHHVPELNAKLLLDAFLDFKIPVEVPLGIRTQYTLNHSHQHVKAVVTMRILRRGPTLLSVSQVLWMTVQAPQASVLWDQ
ncbi:hypothetical protein EDC04DRAFT_2605812 [Pisolithus marmoratus]|nr:hypothetical protein EDC04DRAFT_2605812 [Pisolithus marmoratus]